MSTSRDKKKRRRKRKQKARHARMLVKVERRLRDLLQMSNRLEARCYSSTGRQAACAWAHGNDELSVMIYGYALSRPWHRPIADLNPTDLKWVSEQNWVTFDPKHPLQLLADCID